VGILPTELNFIDDLPEGLLEKEWRVASQQIGGYLNLRQDAGSTLAENN
jgi:hypothetical protein